jgi:hypothetical protein
MSYNFPESTRVSQFSASAEEVNQDANDLPGGYVIEVSCDVTRDL